MCGINCQSAGLCNVRRRLCNASSSNPHSAATTIDNVPAKPHHGTPNCNSRFARCRSHLGEPMQIWRRCKRCKGASAVRAAAAPLVMSAAMSHLSCNVAHSLQHSSMLSSRQLVHVGRGCGVLQLLKPQGRTWHHCKLSDLSDA